MSFFMSFSEERGSVNDEMLAAAFAVQRFSR
jgi:hypothetical protein